MSKVSLSINITSNKNNYRFVLGEPFSVSRTVTLSNHSNAFFLPEYQTQSFTYKDVFVGDVLSGGSCNVDVLSFCPHNLTHVETSAHILDQSVSQSKIQDLPTNHLQGLVYLLDLSKNLTENDKFITSELVRQELSKISLPISALAIKTPSSLLKQDYDFSGKDFLALNEEAAKEITNFSFEDQKVTTLILDLPSTDSENDKGKLLAHRAFFEIPREGIKFDDMKKKAIVELAYFKDVVQNNYYFIMTPPKIQANAIITDIVFYPLVEQ